MLYHDRVDLWTSTIEEDEMGNDALVWHEHPDVPAEVFPLGTESTVSATTTSTRVVTRYRVVLAPRVAIPAIVSEFGVRIGWGLFVATSSPSTGLILDGGIERHHHRGRLHHYEFITKGIVGG